MGLTGSTLVTRMDRRLAVVAMAVALAVVAATLAPGGRSAQAAPPRPDLIIPSFGLVSWGACAPGKVVFILQMRVANIGTAASPASFVRAFDADGSGWGATVPIPALAPGGAVVVTAPIGYSPHITTAQSHPFRARVDPFATVVELSEFNNQTGVINVVPGGCL